MKTRKITFDVGIADSFHLEFGGRLLLAVGKSINTNINIEFRWDEKSDVMKDAEHALEKHMKKHHKGKDYLIYYWTWSDYD